MEGKEITKRFDALWQLRKSLDEVLQDIQHYVVPYRGEFFMDLTSEHQQRFKRREIYDGTAPNAANLLASQMQGTMTSASHRWFGLRFRNDDLNHDTEAKQWLEECEERVWQALIDSDFFTEAAEVYLDLVSFGTSVIMMEEEGEGVVWSGLDFTALPMMDTYFEMDSRGRPTAIFRNIRYTTENILRRFPDIDEKELKLDKSATDVEARHKVIFAVYYREPDEIGADSGVGTGGLIPPEQRPVGYKYVLKSSGTVLEEGGYYQFPAMVVRWQKVAGSRWGYAPAMICISDVKQLNEVVAHTSEARAKAIDPPYVTTQRGVIGDLDLESGGLTLVTDMDQLAPLLPASDFSQAIEERLRLQQSIRQAFYLDWLDLKESPQMTATEVHARRENQRRLMGPVVGRIQSDFLEPLIINTFEILGRNNQLPPQPEVTVGSEMDIEYTGELARAQKAEVAMGIQSWLGAILEMGQMKPNVMDIPNWDQAIKDLGLQRGVPASLILTDDQIEELRQARAEQEKLRQQIEMQRAAGEAGEAIGRGADALGMRGTNGAEQAGSA